MAKKLCGAKTKHGTCRNPAGAGTGHLGSGPCKRHYGCTDRVELGEARKLAVLELPGYGGAVDVDPHEALLLCIRIVAGEVQYATLKVEQLGGEELLIRVQEESDRPLSMGKDGEDPAVTVTEVKRKGVELATWVRIRHEAMDRLVRYSSAALRAGLEERLVQVAEVQGKLLAGAVEGILRDLGVADRPETPRIVRRHLTQLSQRSGE